jgi:hypothetical protein
MKSAGRDYVGAQDAIVKTFIPAMQTAYGNGGNGASAAATPAALDLLAEIAKARLTSRQIGTNAQGAILVNAIVSPKCSDIQAGVSAATLAEFNPEKALANGVFEVRGGANALAAVAFEPKDGGGRIESDPRWGIIPKTDCTLADGMCVWPALSVAQPRYLLTAYPGSVPLGQDTAVVTDALGEGNNGFFVGMMPDIPDKTQFLVGICMSPNATTDNGTIVGGNLGLHDGILLVPTTSAVCASSYPTQAMLERSSTWYASLTHRAASWLTPSPLFAQLRGFDGDWVGPSGWSPVTYARITGKGTSLAFTSIPKTGSVRKDFVLKVLAKSATNRPVSVVLITIDLANNSGVPAGARIVNPPAQGITGSDGVATIALAVDKAGGYTFVANGALQGAAVNTVVSTTVLNIKNK